MTDAQQREAARQFYYKWNGKGKEDEDARSYWIDVLGNIFGMENITDRVQFEKKVAGEKSKKRIDVYIPETRVLIEQKSLGIPLDKAQAGHEGKTPYEQAKEYDNLLPYEEKSKWIVTSNFAEIWIYNMSVMQPEPVKIQLTDLQAKYHMLDFLVNRETKRINEEMKLSLQAGELVGRLYDAFLKQYKNPEDEETLKSLDKLCVRIVFCLYAEDAGVFGKKALFHDYMAQFEAKNARKALRDLFRVLDQTPEDRDPYLADDDPLLASFPYVNGGLFSDEDIEIPPFTDEIMALLLNKASDDFDWSGISPTIFGAVFESTLNPETRRSGGMHYTSIENIHKVIDPRFLDELKAELAAAKANAVAKTREAALDRLQEKLASLTFLDPAAGSGNFLTESYLSLRKIENQIIAARIAGMKGQQEGQITLGMTGFNPIKVSISQFYGIEINDFAVTVARTALWIAENQMMKETEDIVHMQLDFLPLKTNAYIVEGNALRMDWNEVVPKEKLDYIMGNPPFVGYTYQTHSQKEDLQYVESGIGKNIDYVAGWYFKAAQYIQGTNIETAFVSTNSITQGEQVVEIWKPLIHKYLIHINFAHRTFIWDSEANLKAHVHCVIIGFALHGRTNKMLFTEDYIQEAREINPYLVDSSTVFVEKRSKPICAVPEVRKGSQPTDGGHLIITEDEYEQFLNDEPSAAKYIHLFLGADEFINGRKRYCLWLPDVSPKELLKMKKVMERLKLVRDFRASSKKEATRRWAEKPMLFTENRQPEENFIVIPEVSSGARRYIPIGFLSPDIICSNKLQLVPNADVYEFGILMSNVHMSWMRAVCGRLKSDYDYSAKIVYNNFPWPPTSDEQREKIEATARMILDARSKYPDSSLAELYNDLVMPDELRKAHQANDRAVMQAYGMPIKETDEAACVAWLMRLYQEKTGGEG